MSTTPNPYEAAARATKVTLLAATATGRFDADDLAAFTDDQWQALSDCAGCLYPPSEVTRQMVLDVVRHAEDRERLVGDPFVGL